MAGNAKSASQSRAANRLNKNTTFQIVEAYKTIRTNLLFALSPMKEKMVLVSSAEPSAGKSTVCSNLAITMAQTNARVLLIDTDMRKPTQHKIFRLSNDMGLSKLLGGFSGLEETIYRQVVPNLDVILSGPIPPNPSELLGSSKMEELLSAVSSQYDYIFVDGTPVNVVADSMVIAPRMAGTLLAARQQQTTYEEIKKAVELIRGVHGNILGVVITDVKQKNKMYGNYKSYKSYDYRYGKS